MHSFLNYETNEEKRMHSFLNYEMNEEKRRHSFLNYRCFAIASWSIVTWAVRCSKMSQRTSEFLVLHSTSKKTPPFYALNAVIGFFQI
jgi:hypothetical protein